ncbi:MAG: biotin--[acetyl-CoA-carboxylase] ligase [Epsilonproteobacteria bacterium]|nr:MAG: biotin--[acetyl-CoA-carboxylase] ligase [Campylobacterota bacterium]RLA66110.1 MAG: biotin--[acetyl-CoA-carboxylase] ligase [Campylobacterota bacterium]
MERPQITQHIHLASVDSTQLYLKEHLEDGNILISAEEQTHGVGRQKKKWVHQKNSLAFSFTLKPCEVPTLTPLEVSVLIAKFIKENFALKLKLKWPNDLLNEKGEKCGGILIQNIEGRLIVGVGINLSMERPIEKRELYPPGYFKIITPNKELIRDIYSFILNNRSTPDEIRDLWEEKCIHLGKQVEIDNITGVFEGIGEIGEALIRSDGIIRVYSGQLNPLT